MNLLRIILIILGTLSLLIGLAGIVVPGLPTTPFLLLTAALYIRSSESLHRKLLSNRIIGRYITSYEKNRGITVRTKLYALLMMAVMIMFSCIFFIDSWEIRIIVITAGMVGAAVLFLVVPTTRGPR